MTKYNLQSVSFALIVLVLVLMGRTESTVGQGIAVPDDVKETSLAAEAFNVKQDDIKIPETLGGEARITEIVSSDKVILSVRPEPLKPVSPPPKINASSAYVKELGRDSALFEKNIDKRWPLASITKLMTAVVASEYIRPDQKIVISENAVLTAGKAGDFKIGETFTASDLTKAMLVISSNDAAVALADFYGYKEFVNLMRKKILEIGMRDTIFFDPAGLSILNQTTIPDLEKMVDYILKKYPTIFEISSEPGTTIIELKSDKKRRVPANNRFVGRTDFIGGKTGYTDEARGNLVSVFEYKNRKFLIVVFGTENRFSETQELYDWLRENI